MIARRTFLQTSAFAAIAAAISARGASAAEPLGIALVPRAEMAAAMAAKAEV